MKKSDKQRWWRWLAIGAVGVAVALYYTVRIPAVRVPAGVVKHTERVSLTGRNVRVDVYQPRSASPAPVVLVAHGFSRNRHSMAGWGAQLAEGGFVAVVPDLPAWADHARNARAVGELLILVREGRLLPEASLTDQVALVGFSAGGYATLLAAADHPEVACWVGLDPVGLGRSATQAASRLNCPAFVLRAEPAPWNARGNARDIFAALPGPAFSLLVRNASHVDAENPTSRAANWVCGASAPIRRAVFGRYLLAALRAGLLGDVMALRQLHDASEDEAVTEVEWRQPEAFNPLRQP